MNKEEIIEYNKRCATFIKNDKILEKWYIYENHFLRLKNSVRLDYIEMTHPQPLEKFHSDWNWIMEVCRKLDTLSEDDIVEWTDDYVVLSEELDNSVTRNYDINDVVKAVNKFLIWYEQNK